MGLRFSAINGESTHLDFGLNWARNDNKILDLGELGPVIVVPSNMDTPAIVLHHQEGLPAGSWFGRKVIRADLDANGIAQNVMCDAGSPSGKPSGTPISTNAVSPGSSSRRTAVVPLSTQASQSSRTRATRPSQRCGPGRDGARSRARRK